MWCQVKLDKLMTKLDTDGDGKITLEEFRGLFKQMKQWTAQYYILSLCYIINMLVKDYFFSLIAKLQRNKNMQSKYIFSLVDISSNICLFIKNIYHQLLMMMFKSEDDDLLFFHP